MISTAALGSHDTEQQIFYFVPLARAIDAEVKWELVGSLTSIGDIETRVPALLSLCPGAVTNADAAVTAC